MTPQLDLFKAAAPAYDPAAESRREADAWCPHVLQNLAWSPVTYCFPGFMGAVCERLVERGLATKVDAGNMPPPAFVAGAGFKSEAELRRWFRQSGPHPQFTYTITKAGFATLTSTSQVAAA